MAVMMIMMMMMLVMMAVRMMIIVPFYLSPSGILGRVGMLWYLIVPSTLAPAMCTVVFAVVFLFVFDVFLFVVFAVVFLFVFNVFLFVVCRIL